VADLLAFNVTDKGEKLSCVYSNLLNGTWRLTKGHSLYSNQARPMFSIMRIKWDSITLVGDSAVKK